MQNKKLKKIIKIGKFSFFLHFATTTLCNFKIWKIDPLLDSRSVFSAFEPIQHTHSLLTWSGTYAHTYITMSQQTYSNTNSLSVCYDILYTITHTAMNHYLILWGWCTCPRYTTYWPCILLNPHACVLVLNLTSIQCTYSIVIFSPLSALYHNTVYLKVYNM